MKKGFTLIELLVIITIFAIIASIIIGNVRVVKQKRNFRNTEPVEIATFTNVTKVDINHETKTVTIFTEKGISTYSPVNLENLNINYQAVHVFSKKICCPVSTEYQIQ